MKPVTMEGVLKLLNCTIENLEITEEQVKDNLYELGMNSIGFIQFVVSLEEEFDCEIPDSKLLISEMDTVQKVIDVLQVLYHKEKVVS